MVIAQKSLLRHLPNILTLCRIAVIPPMVLILLSPSKKACFFATLLFAIATITDWLDGYLATSLFTGCLCR